MARLFISYSHEDRDQAQKLALALEARDHTVWWDRQLSSGDSFRRTIENELKECEGAIVIWSQASASSRWVLDEADYAVKEEKLLPVSFESSVPVPMGFGQFHVMDFSSWTGDARAPQLDDIDKKITEILHGNFRDALLEVGRRAGEGRGGKTAALLISRLGSNIGGLPVMRLVAGSAYIAIGLAAVQAASAFLFGGEGLQIHFLMDALFYWAMFMILRAAHQPVALRLGRGRRFFDDAFTFWLLFSAMASVLFFAVLRMGGNVTAQEVYTHAPTVGFVLLTTIVFARLFFSAMGFLFRRV